MSRVILIVMDSLGIGSAADADQFGGGGYTDAGSHTLGHIAEAFARGDCDDDRRSGPLHLPNLTKLGLARASDSSSGSWPAGLDREAEPDGGFAWACEISSGKDTPSGHWEIAGVPVLFDWSYFPNVPDCFPPDLLAAIGNRSGIPGSLGNCHASGTDIIGRLGEEHMRTGTPIYYTSADSVFQIACHEQSFGLQKLRDLCIATREVLDQSDLNIGRVIARPFTGTCAGDFQRTGNRHDYSIPPPAPTILQSLADAGGTVIGIGKIADIYAHTGITEEIRASGHPALWEETLAALDRAPDRSITMTNFVDFDALYGHRRDVAGYGAALEAFDARLPELRAKLQPGDLLVITADHGNDPTWPGTDHTREHVPILLAGDTIPPGTDFGGRDTLADIAQTIAKHLHLPPMPHGVPLV
jgi:phosphopentomutase